MDSYSRSYSDYPIVGQYRCMTRIYTRTGDKGTSALFTGERRPKDDYVFDALGATDELSSTIGLASEMAEDKGHTFTKQLEQIQCVLQDIGSVVATPTSSASNVQQKRVEFSGDQIKVLEEWIDEYTKELPLLRNFILPVSLFRMLLDVVN